MGICSVKASWLTARGWVDSFRALDRPPIPWDVELARWFDDHFSPTERVRTYARLSRRQSADRTSRYVPAPEDANRTFAVVLAKMPRHDRQLLRRGDLLTARQWVADANRSQLEWERMERPVNLTDREMSVAAAVVELLAMRIGATPPAWTKTIGGVRDMLVLDPGLEQMPRSFERAKADAPEPLRRRNIIALPDFLAVA